MWRYLAKMTDHTLLPLGKSGHFCLLGPFLSFLDHFCFLYHFCPFRVVFVLFGPFGYLQKIFIQSWTALWTILYILNRFCLFLNNYVHFVTVLFIWSILYNLHHFRPMGYNLAMVYLAILNFLTMTTILSTFVYFSPIWSQIQLAMRRYLVEKWPN